MRDALDAQIWVDHHQQFSASAAVDLRALWSGFKRLSAIRFEAPWRSTARSA